MAVKYWTFSEFCDHAETSLYAYILKYNNALYYLDCFTLINLSTLEVLENTYQLTNFRVHKFEFEGEKRFKCVFKQCELKEVRRMDIDGLDIKMAAAQSFMERLNDATIKNPYIACETPQNKTIIKSEDGCLPQYISYNEFRKLHNQKFEIKYKNSIYSFEYGISNCKLKEIYPNRFVRKFDCYENMLNNKSFDGKNLEEIWEDCELLKGGIKETSLKGYINKFGTPEQKAELERIFTIAREKLIEQGRKPKASITFRQMLRDKWSDWKRKGKKRYFNIKQ